ncbi:MAG: hypothetical protein P1S60_13120, partial [Anaerolineae bacterium]|nr:hypothetical protein [Anaerolineae bacterium]
NAYLLPQLIGLTRSWFKIHPVYVFFAVVMVGYEVYFERISLYSLWFLFSLGTGVMSGKWGAGEAYWITSISAAIILSGFAFGKLTSLQSMDKRWSIVISLLIPLLLLIQSTRMLHMPTTGPVFGTLARILSIQDISAYADYPYYDAVGYSQVGHLMLPRDYENGHKIMGYVKSAEGPVLSEEAAFTMLAGKPVISNPTQLLNLYNNHMLDTGPLEKMIQEKAFDLIIMRAQFYPPPVLAVIGQHYGLVEHIPMNGFNYIIMKPLSTSQP